eukprot:jgi/Bigna1/63347/fgenesh1_kg.51_\
MSAPPGSMSRLINVFFVLITVFTARRAGAESQDDDALSMYRAAQSEVRLFIGGKYSEYREGRLTHRMMKQAVAERLQMTYSEVKQNRELCLVIESEVERISQKCREGRVEDPSCVLSLESDVVENHGEHGRKVEL